MLDAARPIDVVGGAGGPGGTMPSDLAAPRPRSLYVHIPRQRGSSLPQTRRDPDGLLPAPLKIILAAQAFPKLESGRAPERLDTLAGARWRLPSTRTRAPPARAASRLGQCLGRATSPSGSSEARSLQVPGLNLGPGSHRSPIGRGPVTPCLQSFRPDDVRNFRRGLMRWIAKFSQRPQSCSPTFEIFALSR